MIANYFAEYFKCRTRFVDKKEKTKKQLVYIRKPSCVADFFIGEIEYLQYFMISIKASIIR